MILNTNNEEFKNIIRDIETYISYYYDEMKINKNAYVKNLTKWSENKSRLYELFGNRTKVKIPNSETLYDLQAFRNEMTYTMQQLFGYTLKQHKRIQGLTDKDLFLYNMIDKQMLDILKTGLITMPENEHSIQKGKIKFIKLLSMFNAKMRLKKEVIANKYSMLRNRCILRGGNLVISIDPMDFLTVSDNDCNWSSCHSPNQPYFFGNLYYMTDKMTAMVYLEAIKPYDIGNVFGEDILKIPNKRLRRLVYFDDNLKAIMFSKIYPNNNSQFNKLSIKVIENIMEKSGELYSLDLCSCTEFIEEMNDMDFRITDANVCNITDFAYHNDIHRKLLKGAVLELYHEATLWKDSADYKPIFYSSPKITCPVCDQEIDLLDGEFNDCPICGYSECAHCYEVYRNSNMTTNKKLKGRYCSESCVDEALQERR